ncbi:hypothetical protein CKQ90_34305, partial [Klebsiella pneumoniae]
QARTLYAGMVVNAAGIWGQRIAEYADLRITMFPAKGSLLILDHRINNQARTLYAGMVVNAAGIWGQRIAEYADLRITMF